jgi:hypothetical protein
MAVVEVVPIKKIPAIVSGYFTPGRFSPQFRGMV